MDAQLNVCWQCGASREGVIDPSFVPYTEQPQTISEQAYQESVESSWVAITSCAAFIVTVVAECIYITMYGKQAFSWLTFGASLVIAPILAGWAAAIAEPMIRASRGNH